MSERTSWNDLVYIEHLAGELKGLEGDGHERAWEVFTDMACSQAESNASELIDLRAQVKALEAERDELRAKLAKVRKLEQSLAVSIDSNEHATDVCEGNEEWFRGFSESIEGIHDELVRAIGLEAE